MKKILLLLGMVGLTLAANAQFMIGLQGGYFTQKTSYTFVDDYNKHTDLVAGLQLGGQIKRVYLGAYFSYEQSTDVRFKASSTALYNGTVIDVTDSTHTATQYGFTMGPIVRVRVLSYGNMAFHLLLQGSFSLHPFKMHEESYVTGTAQTVLPQGEYREPVEPYVDSTLTMMFGVRVCPTITYEFSKHLSAELTLDLLSIGYAARMDIDKNFVTGQDGDDVKTTSTIYAGINSFREALKWESPMLRLGFHYKF